MADTDNLELGAMPVPRIVLHANEPISKQVQKRRIEIRSAEQYRDAIVHHASLSVGQSLYAGPNYQNLADYLRRSSRPPSSDSSTHRRLEVDPPHVILHDLSQSEKEKDGTQYFSDIQGLVDTLKNKQSGVEPAVVLFINGYLSPQWILTIGWLCNVDPEFWLRHSDFRTSMSEPTYFTTPALPSSTGNIIRLRVPSIGYRHNNALRNQLEIERLRKNCAKEMDDYISSMKKELRISDGHSIVRSFFIHDQEHYSLDQHMSLCVNKFGNGWIAVIWSDCGADLSNGPQGPWSILRSHSWTTSINPTVIHKPSIALKSRYLPRGSQQDLFQAKLSQSGSVLPLNYGRLHDTKVAAQDAFYAVNDVFNFAAAAESQFLNMLERKIEAETRTQDAKIESSRENHEERHAWTVSNLIYSRNILNDHIRLLKENVLFLKGGAGPTWPRASEEKAQLKVKAGAEALLRDYEYLLERAQTLSKTCDRGIDVAGSNAMIVESRTAIQQARRVNKLTLLAFFFIPASFTTSLFGMNFRQFGQGSLSIWIWIVILVPTYMVSLYVLYYDRSRFLRWLNFSEKKDKDGMTV